MGFLFRLLLCIGIAISVGFGVSYYALTDGRVLGAVRVGPWAAWPQIGHPEPDPYSRAYLARTGLLQLGSAEGIQFVAFTDDGGEPLDPACHYRLTGRTPGAAFWTLVAADLDGRNIAASSALPALHSDRIARRSDGDVDIHVSSAIAPGNWLAIDGDNPFQLQLTLYDAVVFSGGSNTVEEMPAIEKVDCA